MRSTNTTAPCSTSTAVPALPTICVCSASKRRRWSFVSGVCGPPVAPGVLPTTGRPGVEQRVELRARSGQRGTLGEPADEVQEVAATILPVRRIEHQRQPDLGMLIRHVEMRRHDPDYRAPDAVDLDLRVDDGRVSAERRLPQLVGEDRRPARRSAASRSRRRSGRASGATPRTLNKSADALIATTRRGRSGAVRLAGWPTNAPTRENVRVRSWNSRNSGGESQN